MVDLPRLDKNVTDSTYLERNMMVLQVLLNISGNGAGKPYVITPDRVPTLAARRR
jgi:hypothetical protein